MEMKAIRFILLGGLFLLALAGCQKMEKLGGQEVRFKASSASTKAEYESPESGQIFWTEGDQIIIWSDNAVQRYNSAGQEFGTDKYGLYDLVDINGKNASLANHRPNELVYPDASLTYNFWAAYPAAKFPTAPTGASAQYTIEDQEGEGIEDEVIPADMSQAYMFASASGKASNDAITLNFEAGFTTFEVTLVGSPDLADDAELGLETLEMRSTAGLAGSVTATFGSDGISFAPTSTLSSLTYTFPNGAVISKTKSLTFTVIAAPVDVENLEMVFTLTGDTTNTASNFTENGNPITFKAGTKNRLLGMAMSDGSFWFKASTEAASYDDEVTPDLKVGNE